jgi:predicted DCC family thiol-disulfide oxidoreductase YuxK
VTEDVPQGGSASEPVAHPILLYDGVCGLCNRLVQFVLRRDPAGVVRFAALQSELATRILTRHGADARDLDTVYVVVNYELSDENLLSLSDAVIFILQHLGAADLRGAGRVLQVVPRPLREWGYRLVARNRYRIFGRYDTCPMPTEEFRSRFLA